MCTDSYGDGWNNAAITIDGVKYCDNFDHGSEMVVEVIITCDWVMPVTENHNGSPGNLHCFCSSFTIQIVQKP